MKLKIRITTPKGGAKSAEKKLRHFVLGFNKPKQLQINKDNSEIIWFIDADPRKAMKISKNVSRYEFFVKGILDNKMVRRTLKTKLKPGQKEELEAMLLDQTKVEII